MSNYANNKHVHAPATTPVPSSTYVKCTGKANFTEKGINVSNNNIYKMHSGHVSKPVT